MTPELQLKSELDHILARLGSADELTEAQKSESYARISQISDELITLSKRGDSSSFIVNLLNAKFIPNGAWRVSRSYASFQISGAVGNRPYAISEVQGYKAKIDTGRGGQSVDGSGWRVKLDSLWVKSIDVANDLVRQINGDLPALLSDPKCKKTLGCFVSPTRVPAPELIEKHKAELHVYLAALVSEGNLLWRKTKDYRQVSDLSRMAVDILGVTTEWHENFAALVPCPACGTKIMPNIVKCNACSAILDRKRAIEFGLIVEPQPRAGR